MRYYFAPMEGITGYIYRSAYHHFFQGMDKYFTPFIKPNQNGHFSSREKNDILPEHNQGMQVVPQILTNCSEDFLDTAGKLQEMGYDEINLNLGCPAKTVVNKRRGSGFLADPEGLDRFLDAVFSKAEIKISIKTRIGKDDPEEFHDLIRIYNKYPLEELIIHPRIQQDFYKNTPNWQVFAEAAELSKNPLCYNGDIFTLEDYQQVCQEFDSVRMVMLGRGLLANPGLAGQIKTGKGLDKERLRAFHDRIYADYQSEMSGEKNVLFKMKEIWFYMAKAFTQPEKYAKKIRKAERLVRYDEAVAALFHEQEIREELV